MLSFDEMNIYEPLKIYDQYAMYPELDFFDKKFIKSKALIYKGKNKSIKISHKSPLENEIKHFFNAKKIFTDINFAKEILVFLKRI